jgi:hypothetical protein
MLVKYMGKETAKIMNKLEVQLSFKNTIFGALRRMHTRQST